jgi:hypothetical protein
MSEVFEICYGVKPGALLRIGSKEASLFADKFFNAKPDETHKMVDPCKEDEHDKVFSGHYKACNPPRWFWVCKTCGEEGTEEAHIVSPKNIHEFAKYYLKFHPEDTWWRRFLKDEE